MLVESARRPETQAGGGRVVKSKQSHLLHTSWEVNAVSRLYVAPPLSSLLQQHPFKTLPQAPAMQTQRMSLLLPHQNSQQGISFEVNDTPGGVVLAPLSVSTIWGQGWGGCLLLILGFSSNRKFAWMVNGQ